MRIVIGEDEALLREGLSLVVARAGHEVVGAAEDAESLTAEVRRTLPDLVIADIRMPPTHTDDGLRAVQELRAELPRLAAVLLSQHVNRRYALELLEQDSTRVGYLLKQRIAAVETFCADLQRIVDGATVIDPELVTSLLSSRRAGDPIERLTLRQREVLAEMAEGKSNAAIAAKLVVSEKAVVRHTSHIYDALGIAPDGDGHRRVLAVVRYLSAH